MRRSYEAYAHGDLEGALAAIDPRIEVRDHDIPDAGVYHGQEGMFRWQADWEASWESWRWEPAEFIDAGDRVVAVLRVYAKGRGSGVDIERLDGAVWTMRNGKSVFDSITTAARPMLSKPPDFGSSPRFWFARFASVLAARQDAPNGRAATARRGLRRTPLRPRHTRTAGP